ncbi:MAG: sigma-70 family RNA polymerase sigma factor [Planctomycetota bacterium]
MDGPTTEAFNGVIKDHSDRLRRMIAGRMSTTLRRRIDADDILQETLQTAAQRFEDYHRSRSVTPYVWLRAIAMDRLIDAHRFHLQAEKRNADREWSPMQFDSSSALNLSAICLGIHSTPSANAIKMERKRQVQDALTQLGDRDRQILAMRFFERMSLVEVAQAAGVTANHVKVLQYRALRRLGRLLDSLRQEVEG